VAWPVAAGGLFTVQNHAWANPSLHPTASRELFLGGVVSRRVSLSLAGIQISASEPVEQSPQPVSRVRCRWHRVSGVDLGRHPQMGAGGHRVSGVRLKRHRGVGVCKNRSFQSAAAPSTRQWSRPLYIGRFSGGVVSRRLTLSLGRGAVQGNP